MDCLVDIDKLIDDLEEDETSGKVVRKYLAYTRI